MAARIRACQQRKADNTIQVKAAISLHVDRAVAVIKEELSQMIAKAVWRPVHLVDLLVAYHKC